MPDTISAPITTPIAPKINNIKASIIEFHGTKR
jgi:hypothetical protein